MNESQGTVFNACSKSAMMSLMCSIPTDTCIPWCGYTSDIATYKEHTHPNQIWRHACLRALFLGQFRVRRRCGVDNKRLGIAHVGEVACKSESVHHFARNAMLTLDIKVQHASVRIRAEQFLGAFVVGVIFVAQI